MKIVLVSLIRFYSLIYGDIAFKSFYLNNVFVHLFELTITLGYLSTIKFRINEN